MQVFKTVKEMLKMFGRLIKTTFQVAYGVWRVNKLPEPRITIFGGHHLGPQSPYAHQAYALADMLVKNDFSVMTGGGPGIMQAANCGALLGRTGTPRTLGINVKIPGHEDTNPCIGGLSLSLDYLFARKLLLMHYADGFVIFPGGIGTLDELLELLVLIDIGKLKAVPIVLIGVEFWQPIMDWLYSGHNKELIHETVLMYLTVTDDNERAFELLRAKSIHQ